MEPSESIELIDNMAVRILSSGKITDQRTAYEIARRWFKGSVG